MDGERPESARIVRLRETERGIIHPFAQSDRETTPNTQHYYEQFAKGYFLQIVSY